MNYPNEFWHPSYFKILAAGFGEAIGADKENRRGTDRSTLRLTVRCFDPVAIPQTLTVHSENSWTTCRIDLIGWEIGDDDLPVGFDGPDRGGSMEEVPWEYEYPYRAPGEDRLIRQ